MDFREIFDLFYNLNDHLENAVADYGVWIYLFLFLIVFSETGLIIFAFLPGDSLIFAAGSLAAIDAIDPLTTFLLIPFAAFAGDQVNYLLGKVIGNRVIKRSKLPFLSEENLKKTQQFYTRHGAMTIIYGRYIPVIRSFAPFVAASGNNMPYGRFVKFSVIGSFSWSLLFLSIGYFLGTIPFVKNNFYFVAMGIVLISMVPAVIQLFIMRRKSRKRPK
jgi:membrane-associated protein